MSKTIKSYGIKPNKTCSNRYVVSSGSSYAINRQKIVLDICFIILGIIITVAVLVA